MGDNIVYDRFIVPVSLHYYGFTDNLERRKQYKTTALQQYIDQYGWENIKTVIVAEGLEKKEAELLENKLIKEGWERGDCINKKCSGGYERDDSKEYRKQYYKEHKDESLKYQTQWRKDNPEKLKEQRKRADSNRKEKKREYDKEYRQTPKRKIYMMVANYNRYHTPIETPLEAMTKYLETGYIPNYIKNDDLRT